MELAEVSANAQTGVLASDGRVTRIAATSHLTGSQKAAIIVQMILSQGGKVPLSELDRDSQVRLACDFSSMGMIDRQTLHRVVDEFEQRIGAGGLNFPDTIADALNALDGQISADLSEELRGKFNLVEEVDPWGAIIQMEPKPLAAIVANESPKIGAIILSRLSAELASEVIEHLEPESANAITLAISQTESIPPEMVRQIGYSISGAAGNSALPSAFSTLPVARAAAILNAATSSQRDAILAALDEKDTDFAAQVRKAIFTFADIPARIKAEDIPKITRAVPGEDLVTALAAAQQDFAEAVAHIFDNMSKRMAEQLREEMSEMGPVKQKIGEQAMGQVTSAIRALVDQGELEMVQTDDEDPNE